MEKLQAGISSSNSVSLFSLAHNSRVKHFCEWNLKWIFLCNLALKDYFTLITLKFTTVFTNRHEMFNLTHKAPLWYTKAEDSFLTFCQRVALSCYRTKPLGSMLTSHYCNIWCQKMITLLQNTDLTWSLANNRTKRH